MKPNLNLSNFFNTKKFTVKLFSLHFIHKYFLQYVLQFRTFMQQRISQREQMKRNLSITRDFSTPVESPILPFYREKGNKSLFFSHDNQPKEKKITKKKKKRTKCWRRAVRFTRLSFKVPKLIVQIKERATSRTKATVTHSSFKAALFKASLYEPPNCVIGEKAHSLHSVAKRLFYPSLHCIHDDHRLHVYSSIFSLFIINLSRSPSLVRLFLT